MAKAVVWTVKKLAEQNRKRVAKKRAKQGKQAQAVQQAAAAAPKPVIKIIRSGPGPAKTTPTKPVAQSKPESIKKPVHQKPTPARKQSKPQPQPAPKTAPPRSSAAVAPPKQQPFAPPSRPAVKTLPQPVTNAAPASHPKQLPKVAPPPRPVARVAPSPPPRPVLAQAAPPPPRPKQAVPPPRPALQEPAKAKPKKFEKPVPVGLPMIRRLNLHRAVRCRWMRCEVCSCCCWSPAVSAFPKRRNIRSWPALGLPPPPRLCDRLSGSDCRRGTC